MSVPPNPAWPWHPPTSNCLFLGRFCPQVSLESRANQQSLQRAFPLHPPGVRGRCHAGSPARSPRAVGHRYGSGGLVCWGGDSEGTEVALSFAAGSASRPRATPSGSWPRRSSSAGLGQQRDREEQDEAPIAAGTDPDPCIALCSLGTCLSTGALGTLSSWLWNAVGGQEEASVPAPHCGGGTWGVRVAAPGSSSVP